LLLGRSAFADHFNVLDLAVHRQAEAAREAVAGVPPQMREIIATADSCIAEMKAESTNAGVFYREREGHRHRLKWKVRLYPTMKVQVLQQWQPRLAPTVERMDEDGEVVTAEMNANTIEATITISDGGNGRVAPGGIGMKGGRGRDEQVVAEASFLHRGVVVTNDGALPKERM
jgi:hypothetical protein